jgi:hypothetical protein
MLPTCLLVCTLLHRYMYFLGDRLDIRDGYNMLLLFVARRLTASIHQQSNEDFSKLWVHVFVMSAHSPSEAIQNKSFVCTRADIIDKHGHVARILLNTSAKLLNQPELDKRNEFLQALRARTYIFITGFTKPDTRFAASDSPVFTFNSKMRFESEPVLEKFKPVRMLPQYGALVEDFYKSTGQFCSI